MKIGLGFIQHSLFQIVFLVVNSRLSLFRFSLDRVYHRHVVTRNDNKLLDLIYHGPDFISPCHNDLPQKVPALVPNNILISIFRIHLDRTVRDCHTFLSARAKAGASSSLILGAGANLAFYVIKRIIFFWKFF